MTSDTGLGKAQQVTITTKSSSGGKKKTRKPKQQPGTVVNGGNGSTDLSPWHVTPPVGQEGHEQNQTQPKQPKAVTRRVITTEL